MLVSLCFKPDRPQRIISGLLSWCFEPSQPQRITSGLDYIWAMGDFYKEIYKAEIRPEEQSEKAERCRENFHGRLSLIHI